MRYAILWWILSLSIAWTAFTQFSLPISHIKSKTALCGIFLHSSDLPAVLNLLSIEVFNIAVFFTSSLA